MAFRKIKTQEEIQKAIKNNPELVAEMEICSFTNNLNKSIQRLDLSKDEVIEIVNSLYRK